VGILAAAAFYFGDQIGENESSIYKRDAMMENKLRRRI
jgi:hypothetical protein